VKGTSSRAPLTSTQVGLKYGFRSGLEERIASSLKAQGVAFTFEELTVEYLRPARKAKYTPDFVLLANGIIVETKGRFVTADRQKHLQVKASHPGLDIRFVFSNSRSRISKKSTTTYADWCKKYGFQYADKDVPVTWIGEPKSEQRVMALEAARVR
jgi:hypothetical protein